jgi:hypothetical protein
MFDRSTARPSAWVMGRAASASQIKGWRDGLPGPDAAVWLGNCKPYGRLNVSIGDSDELGSFVFRTTGFNSIRTLAARLQYFAAVSGGHLACMPLELKLRGIDHAVTSRSHLLRRLGRALRAIAERGHWASQTWLQSAWLRALIRWPWTCCTPRLCQWLLEDAPDEVAEIVEEFYPDGSPTLTGSAIEPMMAPQTGCAMVRIVRHLKDRDRIDRSTYTVYLHTVMLSRVLLHCGQDYES